jgi:hypothetical protein
MKEKIEVAIDFVHDVLYLGNAKSLIISTYAQYTNYSFV